MMPRRRRRKKVARNSELTAFDSCHFLSRLNEQDKLVEFDMSCVMSYWCVGRWRVPVGAQPSEKPIRGSH
jgi:hypothetical protein